MKQVFVKKTSALLVALMVISILTPVIAFARVGFTNISTSGTTVTGQVYVTSDVYDNGVSPEIYLFDANGHILDSTGNPAVAAATYDHKNVNGDVYYNFTVPATAYATYGALYFEYFYPSNNDLGVSNWVYRANSPSPVIIPGPGGNTGSVDNTIFVDVNGNVNAADLVNALANDGKATVTITGDTAVLPASALVNGQSITVATDEGASYTLPITALDLNALASSLGVALGDLKIEVSVTALSGTQASDAAKAATSANANLRSAAIDFTVTAVGGGKEQAISNFPVYVERALPVTGNVSNPGTLVVVRINPTTGALEPVPTTITTVDGKTTATAHSRSNSVYAVIETSSKSFTDLANHWAKADVERLANKLIVTGTSATTFEPKRSITRAEVAALLVRALGLQTSGTSTKFSDVASGTWYTGVVAAAADAGIINGYADGTFKPNAAITRRDLAAMVVRAQKFAGKSVTLTDAEVSQALSAYTDAATLGGQKAEVAAAVSSGLLKGQTGTKIAGTANTNRAEAATIIARLLTNVGFIS